jgi:hypothetical protein
VRARPKALQLPGFDGTSHLAGARRANTYLVRHFSRYLRLVPSLTLPPQIDLSEAKALGKNAKNILVSNKNKNILINRRK